MRRNLGQSIRHGLAWSLAGTIIVRLGGLVVGIVLARLLTPEQFGVYAVALTVTTILITLADLGLGAVLLRADDPERLAPTVATLGLLAGTLLAGGMALSSGIVAAAFGIPDAAPVIAVLSLSLLLGGIAVVPYSLLLRNFEQNKLFATSVVEFAVGTVVSIGLVLLGLGPMALALARIAAQCTSTAMQFVLARWRPRVGFDRAVAGPALRFGLQASSAAVLSVVLMNIDNMVIARIAGDVSLGFYALAFNIASWPMTAIGQAVRSVSIQAFAESERQRVVRGNAGRDPSLAVGTTFAWAAAVPVGTLLAVLSVPLIGVLYGGRWIPASAALAALGAFGALRVLLTVIDYYLLARGAAGTVAWIQVLWIVALTPAMVAGTYLFGITGGGWSHMIIGVCVMLPVYLVAAQRAGADVSAVVRGLIPPVLAAVPCWYAARWVASSFETPLLGLTCGGITGVVVYLGLIHRWIMRVWQSIHRPSAAALSTRGKR
ncbi:oligosaccharide flippase family protein [Rhodococcus daqingensis]|uniref:Oligosaccharide flippase family protein n=1 Tax=Rhodococcus daqingensis TaxID=2479363 RepID=A0ABW2RYH6_9NOCA